jgi:hypothetical protein
MNWTASRATPPSDGLAVIAGRVRWTVPASGWDCPCAALALLVPPSRLHRLDLALMRRLPMSTTTTQIVEVATPRGRTIRLPVGGDEYVRRDAGVDVEVLAEMDSSLVVIDTYLSRPGGGSYCQAGHERFCACCASKATSPTSP